MSIYRANRPKEKTGYPERFRNDFEALRLEARLCVDLKVLSMKKQAELSALMDGIGRQITGRRNASR